MPPPILFCPACNYPIDGYSYPTIKVIYWKYYFQTEQGRFEVVTILKKIICSSTVAFYHACILDYQTINLVVYAH